MALDSGLHIEKRDSYYLVVEPSAPNWLGTDADGARLLRTLRSGVSLEEASRRYSKRAGVGLREALLQVTRFAREAEAFVSGESPPPYAGRARYLQPDQLREVWLHVTDRCNLSCRHCLVSSGPRGHEGLPGNVLREIVKQARDLGAGTFYFTGGEPMLRADICELLGAVTQTYGATAVVLTNGTLLDDELTSRLAELPRHRLYLQVSLDGSSPERNDAVRAPGSFEAATRGIQTALRAGLNVTVAAVALRRNLDDLIPLADTVRDLGVAHLHLMWQHVRERGAGLPRADLRQLIAAVRGMKRRADEIGLVIDNIENMHRVVNGDPNTKYDLSNACWDSLAIHRDGRVFPSACLVGIASEAAGSVAEELLRDIWLKSDIFSAHREESVISSAAADGDPLLFLHGGGDPEHAFFAGNGAGGKAIDPYLPLHREMAKAVMDEIVCERRSLLPSTSRGPIVYHVMGEDGYGCPVESGARNGGAHKVDFIHSNCVLIQDVIAKTRAQIRKYYGEAAREPKTEICSPVGLDQRYLTHIPDEVVARSYGCGSPVFRAELQPGETVVDLGSGAGLECFIASRLVRAEGRVVGVDMTEDMLDFSRRAAGEVAENLGYGNVHFQRALLEGLPLAEGCADAVISNCVINLSPEKMRVFAEIRRILRPGGRAVISDIVSERELPAELRFNPRLRGECIAGAMTEEKLVRALEKVGFSGLEVLSKTEWRTVDEVPFHSITLRAWKLEGQADDIAYTYPGPFRSVTLDSGQELIRGIPTRVSQILVPTATNGDGRQLGRSAHVPAARRIRDCMVCGRPLVYLDAETSVACHYCGRARPANARCEAGHFVCDECHVGDHLEFIKAFCSHAEDTDPVALFLRMRRSHLFPLHGPEHHALVPAAFLTAYGNRHGRLAAPRLQAAVERGARLPGGTCAYWGGCAAALGIGIAYSTILGANPLSEGPRGAVQTVVSEILSELGRYRAARCCRRESYLALKIGCELSGEHLGRELPTGESAICDQSAMNRECLGRECPLHPNHRA